VTIVVGVGRLLADWRNRMFVVYEVCSGWSEDSWRFDNWFEADCHATMMWEKYGTEFRVREEN
jgi:hypothetical protein